MLKFAKNRQDQLEDQKRRFWYISNAMGALRFLGGYTNHHDDITVFL